MVEQPFGMGVPIALACVDAIVGIGVGVGVRMYVKAMHIVHCTSHDNGICSAAEPRQRGEVRDVTAVCVIGIRFLFLRVKNTTVYFMIFRSEKRDT